MSELKKLKDYMEKEIADSINTDIESAREKIKTYYSQPTQEYTEKGNKFRRIYKILYNIQNDITELSK